MAEESRNLVGNVDYGRIIDEIEFYLDAFNLSKESIEAFEKENGLVRGRLETRLQRILESEALNE